MAEHNVGYPHQQEYNEEVVNTTLHNGGNVFFGMKTAATDVTNSILFAPALHPSSSYSVECHPDASLQSVKKNSATGSTSNDGKQKLYEMPPNPADPIFEKKRIKAVKSQKNRQRQKQQAEALQSTKIEIKANVEDLRMEKMILQQSIEYLKLQKQNVQDQACGDGCYIPQEYP